RSATAGGACPDGPASSACACPGIRLPVRRGFRGGPAWLAWHRPLPPVAHCDRRPPPAPGGGGASARALLSATRDSPCRDEASPAGCPFSPVEVLMMPSA